MRWGIPSFRLPETVLDGEIQRIVDMGVEVKLKTMVGTEVAISMSPTCSVDSVKRKT